MIAVGFVGRGDVLLGKRTFGFWEGFVPWRLLINLKVWVIVSTVTMN